VNWLRFDGVGPAAGEVRTEFPANREKQGILRILASFRPERLKKQIRFTVAYTKIPCAIRTGN
jgi:hypothetical protein